MGISPHFLDKHQEQFFVAAHWSDRVFDVVATKASLRSGYSGPLAGITVKIRHAAMASQS